MLPKHWRGAGQRVVELVPAAGGTSVAVVYEGDTLALPAGSPEAALALEAVRDKDSTSSVLWGLSSVSRDDVAGAASTDLRHLPALYGLAGAADVQAPPATLSLGPDAAAPPAYLWARLVALTEPLARKVRQGYVEREERLPAMRGRIVAEDIPRALAERRTHLLCRFDDLTPGTTLQRVVVTALDVCTRPADGVTALLGQVLGRIPQRAVQVRRLLRDIPSLPPAEAVRLGRGLRPGRLDAAWRPVLEVALQVLSGQHAGPVNDTDDRVDVREVVVRSEKLWENLLDRAMRQRWPGVRVLRSELGQLGEHAKVPAPWAGARSRSREEDKSYPDFLVLNNDVVWCGDAKYKRLGVWGPEGDYSVAPDRADLYQLFAYSHLARGLAPRRPVTRCALLYPAERGGPAGLLRTLHREPDRLELDVLTLPWPEPGDAQRPIAAYLSRLAAALPSLTTP
ncbi:McrBC 5-methylcytosine restriction system component [Geodermatophilus tzadiensis]|uniref:McrBC 5-methylcytosine restriction system component n=1 Tax=Geodermatophilus tzadiensis TaxID=1137988 RepID=A0A2T0TSH5_9ACTN|nr:hypothetical protein [Geodermatophilus tzadiensis]PRY48625.1 McrBC 5-methylcytosine restriction system component [Geodermatophilus tzadiensis]